MPPATDEEFEQQTAGLPSDGIDFLLRLSAYDCQPTNIYKVVYSQLSGIPY